MKTPTAPAANTTDITNMSDEALDALLGYSPCCSEICERHAKGVRARMAANPGHERFMRGVFARAAR